MHSLPRRLSTALAVVPVLLAAPGGARIRHAASVVRTIDADPAGPIPSPTSAAPAAAATVALPSAVPGALAFVENLGQAGAGAPFYARGDGRTIRLEPHAIHVELRRRDPAAQPARPAGAVPATGSCPPRDEARVLSTELVETLVGGSDRVRLEGGAEEPGRYNYLLGNDPARWRTGARSYRLVTYRNAWEGVDLRLYGEGPDLEQEYVVRPGGPTGRIRVRLHGGRGLAIERDGSLVVRTALGPLRQRAPVAYQHVGGRRVSVPVRFALLGRDTYGFAVGAYDHSAPLVIDPVMRFATFMGGIHDDVAQAVAVDPAGNTYAVGFTASEDFPVTGGAYQSTRKNIGQYVYNVFVAKLSPAGVPLYSTFLGGDGAGGLTGDKGNAIALDDAGNIYIAGQTDSSNFPITPGTAFQTSKAASTDAFFTELSADGTQLLYSTFLGGSGADVAVGLALDAQKRVYLVGNAPAAGFPTKSAYQTTPHGTDNGFVAKLDPTASGAASLVYSTYLGGNGNFGGLFAIAVDANGNAYVTGQTQASDFPTTTGVLKEHMTLNASCSTSNPPRSAAVVAKLTPDGSGLVWSTYLSGTNENQVGSVGCDQYGHAIAVDGAGQVYVQGATNTTDFPTSANAVQKTFGCCQFQNFVMKLKADASDFVYSTLLSGGNERSFPGGQLVLDGTGNLAMTGVTFGSQWATTPDALQPASGGGIDAFVTRLNADASGYVYSSYLGGAGSDGGNGIAIDGTGNTHVVGSSDSSAGFPWTSGAFQNHFAGGDRSDAFMAAFGSPLASAIGPSHAGNAGGVTLTVAGSGFTDGVVARLTGAQTVTARQTKAAADGKSLKAVFDLTHVPPGAYSLSVLAQGATIFTSPQPFTVDAGGGPSLWVDVIGRPKIRVNTPSTFFLTYGNSGNQDAYFVRLWMSVPTASLVIAPGFQLSSSGAGTTTSANHDRTVLSLVVPVVPAGSTAALPITVTAPAAATGIPIAAWVNPAAFMSLTALDALQSGAAQRLARGPIAPEAAGTLTLGSMTLGDCYERMIAYSVAALGFNLPQTCLGLFTVGFKDEVAAMVSAAIGSDAPPEVFAAALGQVLYNVVQQQVVPCVQQTLGLVSPDAAQKIVDGLIDSLVDLVDNTILNQDCQVLVTIEEDGDEDDGGDDDSDDGDDPTCVCPPATSDGGTCSDCGSSGGAIDPNDKSGPGGGGAGRWVAPTTPLRYLVEFENEAAATAPAQQVVVTDQLDAAKVDLSTFALGPIFFGSHSVTPPAGATHFTTTVDLRPAQDLLVQITAQLNAGTGLVTWTLASLDPATNLPPADPTVGFLPPDTQPPAGAGGMLFTVLPASGLASGTTVANQASIVFDANAPIVTPVWTNTIDKSAPTSLVTSLAASQSTTRFTVAWSGSTPNGPGIQDYTILVGVDGGPLVPWLTNTTATSATYVGKPGHSYAFASRARSLGSVREATHTAADTTTSVSAKALAGKLKVSPRKLAFGGTAVGKTFRKARAITLRNAGKRKKGVPVGLGIVRTTGDFYVVKNECPPSLDPGKSCRLSVNFAPAATGRRSGTVAIDNDTAASPLVVRASGKGKGAKKGK